MTVVIAEKKGAVAHLRLNRPDVLNAINDQVCEQLVATIDDLEREEGVSVV